MIAWVLQGIAGILDWVIGFLPDISIPAQLMQGIAGIVQWICWINYYIPLDVFFIIVPLVFGSWLICAVISAVLQLL